MDEREKVERGLSRYSSRFRWIFEIKYREIFLTSKQFWRKLNRKTTSTYLGFNWICWVRRWHCRVENNETIVYKKLPSEMCFQAKQLYVKPWRIKIHSVENISWVSCIYYWITVSITKRFEGKPKCFEKICAKASVSHIND